MVQRAKFFMEKLRQRGWLQVDAETAQPNFYLQYNPQMIAIAFSAFSEINFNRNRMPTESLARFTPQPNSIYSNSFLFLDRQAYSSEETFSILDTYTSKQKETLFSYGMKPSMANVIKLWSFEEVLHGNLKVIFDSHGMKDMSERIYWGEFNDPILATIENTKQYMCELIQAEVGFKIVFRLMNSELDEKFFKTGEFPFSVEALKGLEGLPADYINKILNPIKALN